MMPLRRLNRLVVKLSKKHLLYHIINVVVATAAFLGAAAMALAFFIDDMQYIGLILNVFILVLLGTTNTVAALRHRRLKETLDKDGF